MAAEINELQAATIDSFARADELRKLGRGAPDLFQQQDRDKQARLVRLTESNATFDGTAFAPEYTEPFDLLAEGLEDQTGGANEVVTQTVQLVRRFQTRRGRRDIQILDLAA